jgi:hypothetical protein
MCEPFLLKTTPAAKSRIIEAFFPEPTIRLRSLPVPGQAGQKGWRFHPYVVASLRSGKLKIRRP